MIFSVVWRPAARADLLSLYDWIALQADRQTAYRYTAGIETLTAALSRYPQRGAPRPDLQTDVRTLIYRRRTVIAYVVRDSVVEIVALAHAGRELTAMFSADEE